MKHSFEFGRIQIPTLLPLPTPRFSIFPHFQPFLFKIQLEFPQREIHYFFFLFQRHPRAEPAPHRASGVPAPLLLLRPGHRQRQVGVWKREFKGGRRKNAMLLFFIWKSRCFLLAAALGENAIKLFVRQMRHRKR